MLRSIVALLLLAVAPAYADDYRQIVATALANVSQDYHHHWAFTETDISSDGVVVGRYDPRNEEQSRWTLVSIDDRKPTPQEVAEYQEDKSTDFEEDESDDGFDVVDLDTLELVDESDESWLFAFSPNADQEEDKEAKKMMQGLVGHIAVGRANNQLLYLDLFSEKPIKPAFGVKISQFRTRLGFAPAQADGPTVPVSVDVEIRGRAMLAIKFDEIEQIRMTDYLLVGP